MRLSLIVMVCLIIVSGLVVAQSAPTNPNDVKTMNKVAQEHQNTRKFFQDELTRQRNEFFKQMDDRFTYYERTFDNFMTRTAFKLGLMWAGIVMLSIGSYSVFRVRLDKKRNKRFNDTMRELIRKEVNMAVSNVANLQSQNQSFDDTKQEDNEDFAGVAQIKRPHLEGQRPLPKVNPIQQQPAQTMPIPPKPKKLGFFERRRQKKQMKKLDRLEKSEQYIKEKKAKIMGEVMPIQQPIPQPTPQMPIEQGFADSQHKQKRANPSATMNFDYEVQQ